MCRVISIYCKFKNQPEGKTQKQAFLQKGYGVEGDSHGGKPGRHISIMLMNTKVKIDSLPISGLCIKRFKANILISGGNNIKSGSILNIGQAKIEIKKIGKECFKDCNLHNEGIYCPMAEVIFGDVISSGIIQADDNISIE